MTNARKFPPHQGICFLCVFVSCTFRCRLVHKVRLTNYIQKESGNVISRHLTMSLASVPSPAECSSQPTNRPHHVSIVGVRARHLLGLGVPPRLLPVRIIHSLPAPSLFVFFLLFLLLLHGEHRHVWNGHHSIPGSMGLMEPWQRGRGPNQRRLRDQLRELLVCVLEAVGPLARQVVPPGYPRDACVDRDGFEVFSPKCAFAALICIICVLCCRCISKQQER